MKNRDNRRENNRITVVLAILCGMFIIPILYMSYFQIFRAEEIKDHYSNRRIWAGEEKILRGSISDRNGELLAYSERDENGDQSRIYEYGSQYAHIIGYSYRTYGRSALEEEYNSELLNLEEKDPIAQLRDILQSEEEKYGKNLQLTIDHRLQARAYELLGDKHGVIGMINPETGEVYAMASTPTFDPRKMSEEWESIVEDEDSPLLNRATSGRYAPGSIFKIVTATGIIESLNPYEEYSCDGSVVVDGYEFKNYGGRAHGQVDLEEALERSTNTYFVEKALELGEGGMKDLASRFMLNEKIPFDLSTVESSFPTDNMGKTDIGASGIGQGRVSVTPLNMLLMTSAVANDGDMVKPILVDEVLTHDGLVEEDRKTEIISQVMDDQVSEELTDYMVGVVENGTGTAARISGIDVAGKTGTAENETPNAHAWFTGFAPADNPKLAVIVMLEYSGSTGGSAAAPIAKDIMEYGLEIIE